MFDQTPIAAHANHNWIKINSTEVPRTLAHIYANKHVYI